MAERRPTDARRETAAVKSASRALDILELVAHAGAPPNSTELSARLGIPKSSLSLLLATLVQRGYLEHVDQRGGYRLGLASERLAVQVTRARGSVERVVPLLRRLSGTLNETSGYYERRDDFIECVEMEPCNQALAFMMHIGERVRLYANSCGKAYLASLSQDELDQYLDRTELRPYTPTTITKAEELTRALDEIRQTGISRSFGEYIPGIVAVAVPLYEGGRFVGAFNVGLPESRYDTAMDEAIVRELQTAARQFARLSKGPVAA